MILTESGSYRHPDDPGEPSTGDPRLSVTDLEAAILMVLVDGLMVLEIGTGLGVSTRALAASAAVVHTVDVDPWVQATIWPGLPDNVICHESVATVPAVDAAFIDGDHSEDATRRDLESTDARLVIVHDANSPTVKAALGDGWRIIPTTHGLAVRRR